MPVVVGKAVAEVHNYINTGSSGKLRKYEMYFTNKGFGGYEGSDGLLV